ncbi:uncharacterized protein BKA78DRAFT_59057 [Phyllosticta capitalensis]|uniref:uncharacterized protein n=1 Tax=Phyllosticta capitalensis TaxID=121624 RepID=UPI0031306DE5
MSLRPARPAERGLQCACSGGCNMHTIHPCLLPDSDESASSSLSLSTGGATPDSPTLLHHDKYLSPEWRLYSMAKRGCGYPLAAPWGRRSIFCGAIDAHLEALSVPYLSRQINLLSWEVSICCGRVLQEPRGKSKVMPRPCMLFAIPSLAPPQKTE